MTQPDFPSHPVPQLAVAPIKTNLFAVIGFVGVFLHPVIGIVFGTLAKRQIAQTGEGGRGLAQWAFGLGLAGTIFQVVFFIVWLGFFITAMSNIPFAH